MNKQLAFRIFEGFSIQRWNDLIRPFDLVEMDKAAEKMVLTYIIGKYEEHRKKYVDWKWLIYASLFDLLRKISLCDIKAPVQQMLRREFPDEYMRLNEWVLNGYKAMISDEKLFSEFTIYVGQQSGNIPIPTELRTTVNIYRAAHKYSTIRELEMLAVVNEKERLKNIRNELELEIQPYLELEGLQKLMTHQKAFDFILKIEQLRFQTRWNQTPRVPATSVLGHCFFVWSKFEKIPQILSWFPSIVFVVFDPFGQFHGVNIEITQSKITATAYACFINIRNVIDTIHHTQNFIELFFLQSVCFAVEPQNIVTHTGTIHRITLATAKNSFG